MASSSVLSSVYKQRMRFNQKVRKTKEQYVTKRSGFATTQTSAVVAITVVVLVVFVARTLKCVRFASALFCPMNILQ